MLQSRSIKRATLVEQLKTALTGEANHFFADTSFLIAAASLNSTARAELHRWLASLGERFHVPVWVAHEIYGKITAGIDLFAPMAKVAEQAITAIETLQAEARRYVDDERAATFSGQSDRVGYLASLDRLARPLLDQAHVLRGAKQTRESASDWVVELVNGAIMSSDIYGGLSQLDADYTARVIGGHPPGFMDKGKAERTRHGDNRYGDLIIWREIIAFVRDNRLSGVVLLTNDNKTDWVYVPPTILDDDGRPMNNEAHKGFKVILPLPLLVQEVAQARIGAGLTIANLGMLSQLLHELGADGQMLFSAYQPVAAAARAEPEETAAEERDGPVETDESAEPPDLNAAATDDLPDLLKAMRTRGVEAAAAATLTLRERLAGLSAPQVAPAVRELLAAADRGIEAAALLVRDVVTENLAMPDVQRRAILAAMLDALYYDDKAKLRNKPLGNPLADIFSVQTQAAFAVEIAALTERLGPSRRYFLVTPDPAAPTLTLSLAAEKGSSGQSRLQGLYSGELALLEDVARDSPRALTRLMGGATSADGAALRRALAGYFRVPETQLDIGLSRFETVRWDDLTGLIDWGANTGLQLR